MGVRTAVPALTGFLPRIEFSVNAGSEPLRVRGQVVNSASLGSDLETVMLSTSALSAGVLDTLTVNGTSWIERQVPDRDVRFSLSLVAVEVDHVPGTLILAQFPAGLLVVETAANQTHNLSYVDSVRNQTTRLGLISLGTEVNVIVLVSHAQTEVDFAALRLLASGQDPIDRVRIGHTLPTADGGGRIAVQRVSISWPTPDGAYAPLIGPATVLIGLAVLASPVEVYRRLYSGKT